MSGRPLLWHAEWHALAQPFGLASGALREARALAEGLAVDPVRMAANLDSTRGLLFADVCAARRAPRLGAAAAYVLVETAAGRVRDGGGSLHGVLEAMPDSAGTDIGLAFDLTPAIAAATRATGRAARRDRTPVSCTQPVRSRPPRRSAMPLIRYRRARRAVGSSGAPVTAFSKPFGTTLTLWNAVVPVLRGRYRTLLYHTLATLAQDAVAVPEAAGAERAHVCGLSLGDAVAMRLALDHPGRPDRPVVADAAARLGTAEACKNTIGTQSLAVIADMAMERFFDHAFRYDPPGVVTAFRGMLLANPVRGTSISDNLDYRHLINVSRIGNLITHKPVPTDEETRAA